MKCDEIKALYDDFKTGILGNEMLSSVNNHLSSCNDCNNYFIENNKLSKLLDNWDGIEPQHNYVSKFWSRVDEKELSGNKGILGFFKGIKTAFLVPSLAVALFCSLLIINMYKSSTSTPTTTAEDIKDNILLLEINDIISIDGYESLKIYGLWNDLEEGPKEG